VMDRLKESDLLRKLNGRIFLSASLASEALCSAV
jgi:hypothetical protein